MLEHAFKKGVKMNTQRCVRCGNLFETIFDKRQLCDDCAFDDDDEEKESESEEFK